MLAMASASSVSAPLAPLTGWMKKRKSEGGKGQLFKSMNRRYFTLDFDAKLFYYAHSQSSKQISLPIGFCQLISVEPLQAGGAPSDCPDRGENLAAHECSAHGYQTSKGRAGNPGMLPGMNRLPFSSQALMRAMPSLSNRSRCSLEQYGFVLRVPGKSMEIICSSQEEAETWISAIREAIAMSKSSSNASQQPATPSERSTTPPSSRGSTPRSSDLSGTEAAAPWDSPGGKRHEFPPLAPVTEICDRAQHESPPLAPGLLRCPSTRSTTSLGFAGDIVNIHAEEKTPPLAPRVSLRDTATGAQ